MYHALMRLLKHLLFPDWRLSRAFPRTALQAIEQEIAASEASHTGELRFAVEAHLHLAQLLRGVSSRERALDAFSQLHVWDTENNSGVLIYLLLADRQVEIVADRGIHRLVGDAVWQQICHGMEDAFARGEFAGGILAGVREIGAVLARHVPAPADAPDAPDPNPDELPNTPVVL